MQASLFFVLFFLLLDRTYLKLIEEDFTSLPKDVSKLRFQFGNVAN